MNHNSDFGILDNPSMNRYWPAVGFVRVAACCVVLACLAWRPASAQAFNDLYGFSRYTPEYYSGQYPSGNLLLAADGSLYGTTEYGGVSGDGTVFKMDLKGNVTTVHEFTGSGATADGSVPNADLIQAADGQIYGTCHGGGQFNDGTIWKIDPVTDAVTVMHHFAGYDGSIPANSGGRTPYYGVIQASDGNFYGTTEYGGVNGDLSAIYTMAPSGNFKLLHSFDVSTDGASPRGELTEGADGKLYGGNTAGSTNGYGVLFRLAKSGANFSVLVSLDGIEADYNGPLVMATDGNFYSTCSSGGLYGQGAILAFNPATSKLTSIHSFNGVEGSFPYNSLTQAKDGALYGTTQLGGTFGLGTAYKADTTGNVTELHSFNGTDAYGPSGLTQATDGNFYGVSSNGGITAVGNFNYGSGSAFRMTNLGKTTLLHSFSIQKPYWPVDHLIQAQDGLFYGAVSLGGAFDSGAIYRSDAAGSLTLFHSFNNYLQEGSGPYGGVMQGPDGSLFGTTWYGGKYTWGTVYKLNVAGGVTVLHHFRPVEGYLAADSLLLGKDGNFYGALQYDTQGGGSIFKITPAGTFTVLHHFNGVDGAQPRGNLVQDSSGVLYGVCTTGGANGYGTVFSMTTAGATRALYSFQHTDGAYPDGLTLARDGFLYGTCLQGGHNSSFPFQYSGTLFKTDRSSGATSVLTYFDSGSSGGYPQCGIMQGPDGFLYGMCGDSSPGDTAWRVDPATGSSTVLHSFTYTDGYYPNGGLLVGSDGLLYGTTIAGDVDGGNLFSIDSGLSNAVNITGRVIGKIGAPALHGGVWTAKITIKNISASKSAILGPLQFVLTGLPAGATLTSATGTVPAGYTEAGSPYQTAPGGANNILSLPYGVSLTLTVTFNQNVGTTYGVDLYSGRF